MPVWSSPCGVSSARHYPGGVRGVCRYGGTTRRWSARQRGAVQNNENQPRALRRASTQTVAVLAVAAGISLLTTACGGSPSADGPGSAASSSTTSPVARALAYSQCIRSHGVPNYPDPTINGNRINISNVNPSSLGVSQSVLQAAQKDCASLSPMNYVPPGFNKAKNTAEGVKWAQCLREHGEPNFPDPNGNGAFDLPSGTNLQSSALQAAEKACQSLMPQQVEFASGNLPGGSS